MSQSVEPKIGAAGEFAHGAKPDQSIKQTTRRAIGQARRLRRT